MLSLLILVGANPGQLVPPTPTMLGNASPLLPPPLPLRRGSCFNDGTYCTLPHNTADNALSQVEVDAAKPGWEVELRGIFDQHDVVIIRNAFSKEFHQEFLSAAEKFEEDPFQVNEAKDGTHRNYFELDSDGNKMLCRTEHYMELQPFNKWLRAGGIIEELASTVLGVPAALFKERINYKYPGGGAFPAHQDGLSWEGLADEGSSVPLHDRKWAHQPNSEYLDRICNINIALDPTTKENGAIEVAVNLPLWHGNGSYVRTPQKADACILDEVEEAAQWVPAELNPGDAMVFGGAATHRSNPNFSRNKRRVAHFTYNSAAIGDFRAAYYRNYMTHYPPENHRVPGKDYTSGHQSFFWGSPIYNDPSAR